MSRLKIFLIFLQIVRIHNIKLPGNSAIPDLKLKTGYLRGNAEGNWKLFYSLVEARDVARSKAPLLIWFNGGPGCSSLGGMFEEMGPLYPHFDGKTLFENVHSWYHKANLLFIESPIGVGFSYDTKVPNNTKADDLTTAKMNLRAISNFFEKTHKEYSKNDFYIGTESYGGIYGPMLTALIIEAIASHSFPNNNFKGLMIGNGFMNSKLTQNTQIIWSAYHARIHVDEWEEIKEKCKTEGAKDVDEYDFTQFLTTKNKMDYIADNSTECGPLLESLIGKPFEVLPYNFYNYYQDCYVNMTMNKAKDPYKETLKKLKKTGIQAIMNPYGTETLGMSCWLDSAMKTYLNRKDVQRAMGIDRLWQFREKEWSVCNNDLYDAYTMTYDDMTPFFKTIFENNTLDSFKILFYNGDVDTACNYLADQYFARNLAKIHGFKKTIKYTPWFHSDLKNLAGFYLRYEGTNKHHTKLSLDVLNIKGAGHFVPFDRPSQSHQMFYNFINSSNYSTPIFFESK